MNKKTVLGVISLVVLACLLLLILQKLTFEKNIRVVLEAINTTSYDEYADHWAIYKQKRSDFEVNYSEKALESYAFDHLITDAMTSYYHFGCDTEVDAINFDFHDVFNMKKIRCTYTVNVDLHYVTSEREREQLQVYGEATLVREKGEWKVDYMRMTGNNFYEMRQKNR